MLWERNRKYWFACGLIACACFLLSGCLKGKVSTFVRYDADTDTFHQLTVYTNIASTDADELDHLASLWRNRNHLFPAPVGILGQPALLRLSGSEYRTIVLEEPPSSDNEIQRATIPLDQIEIRPGCLFLSKDDTLGCYHHVIIPGKVADAALKHIAEEASESFVGAVSKEQERRREGGKRLSWNALRWKLLTEIAKAKKELADGDNRPSATEADSDASETTAENKDEPTEVEQNPLAYLDDASLEALLREADAPKLFRRRGGELQISVPLSEADCRQAKVTWEMIEEECLALLRRAMTKAIESDTSSQKLPAEFLGKVMALATPTGKPYKVAIDDGNRLTLAVDIDRLLRLHAEFPRDFGKPNPDASLAYRMTVASMKGQGFAMRDDVVPDELADAFYQGRLPSSPPAKGERPGAGMFDDAP